MNKKKGFLMASVAILMTGILLAGFVGCREAPAVPPAEVEQELTELRQYKAGQEAERQKAAEKEELAKIIAQEIAPLEERLAVLEKQLAKEQEEVLANEISELKSQIDKLSRELESLRTARPAPSPTPAPRPAPPYRPPEPTGVFTASLYKGENLSGPVVKTWTDYYPIDYNWGLYGGPAGLTDYFSIRWEGWFYFEPGRYRFKAEVDDGARLSVEDSWMIDKWFSQAATTYEVTKRLSGWHRITLEYFERTRHAVISLHWERIS